MNRFLVLPVLGQLLGAGAILAGEPEVIGKDKRVEEVSLEVAAQPFDLAFSADGKSAFVTHFTAGQLSEIRDNKVVRTAVVGPEPTGIALSKDGKSLFVALANDNVLVVLDVSSLKEIRRVKVGAFPIGVALSPNGRLVAVACLNSNALSLVSTSTWESMNLAVGTGPYFTAFSPDGGRLYTPNYTSNNLTVTQLELDRDPLKAAGIHTAALKTIPVGQNPVGLAVTTDGKKILVANYQGASVSVIDAKALAVEQTLAVGNQPYWVALHPKDGYMMVTNYGSEHVDVIYPDQKHTRITVKNSLVKLFFSPDGRRVFSTNFQLNRVGILE